MIIMKDIIQGSDEWFAEKLGKPSASNISKIVTGAGKPSTQMEGYLHTLAAEIIRGERFESYNNEAMEEGREREEESRKLYEMLEDVEVQQVGMIYKDEQKKFLCSPDGIVIGKEKGLELKNVQPNTQVGYLLNQKLPSKYVCQVQFSLFVTGFESWDFFSYAPLMPHFLINVKRDEKLISLMEVALNEFCEELKEVVARLS